MGLLRGFKAKLHIKTKKKSDENNTGVVCLRYHINPDLYEVPTSVSTQNIGKHEVVKHRRTITKPVVQNVFTETQPKKSNLKQPKTKTHEEDNGVSTLIHMTTDHEENIIKSENEYIEVISPPKNDNRTKLNNENNYASAAESLFFADTSPVMNTRSKNFHLTDYGDRFSQSSQTSA